VKREEVKATDGTTVTVLTPENDADLAEIARMEKEGTIDTRATFADYRSKVTQ
jgi:hypothetical protein